MPTIKSLTTFSPALKPHAEWIDNNVGNKDGQLDDVELESYKAKFPDASQYQPLKTEMLATVGSTGVNTTATTSTGAGVPVGSGGGVLGFMLAQGTAGTTKAGEAKDTAAATGVKTSLPVDSLTKVGASAAGEVFSLDAGSVATMEVRARQVVHPTQGPGTELQLRLTPTQSLKLATGFGTNDIPGATKAPFSLDKAEFKDGATVLDAAGAYQPQASNGTSSYSNGPLQCFKLEEAGKFSVEYVPPSNNPQSYRDRLRVRVYGATDADRRANLEAALARISGAALLANQDPVQAERLQRLSVLRMVNPAKAEELGKRLEAVPLPELEQVLAENGVDAPRLANVRLTEVFPGHVSPVDPALGEAYAKLGVNAVMAGIREVDSAVGILTSDGLMASLERYGRGLHKAGASLSSDEASGGAEFAFTRLIPQKAMDAANTISSSYGAGKVQLLSTGEPMKQLLSRTDWHAYANDCFGVTVSRTQLEGTQPDPVLKSEFDKRTGKFSDRPVLDTLVGQVSGTKPTGSSTTPSNSFATSNEACFKAGVAAQAFTCAVVSDAATRDQLINALKAKGLTELAGKPLEQFVIVAQNWNQVGQALGMVAK